VSERILVLRDRDGQELIGKWLLVAQNPLERMPSKEFQRVLFLEGLPFIKALLEYEQQRFDESYLKGSVFEDINTNFGIFPAQKMYPLYFMGDVRKPENKIIFIGINPGFGAERNAEEQQYLERAGIFEGYCTRFLAHGKVKRRRTAYFGHIGGFLRRLGLLEGKITPEWLQENFINMDLIPYHSTNTSGLRINDLEYYRARYFVPLVKIIEHLDPKRPVFIVGFPTFEEYFEDDVFRGLIDYEKRGGIWVGKLKNKYRFIGLPFLNRPAGGKDKLADIVRQYL
jgi:hypothetical protein